MLLLPESQVRFFSPMEGWVIDFLFDESGEVTGLRALVQGSVMNGTRVD